MAFDWNPFDWWTDGWELVTRIPGDVGGVATNWLSSAAGDIASGLEGAMVAVVGDIWRVIEGPLEIIGGLIILFAVLVWAFKDQIPAIAAAVMK